MSRADLNSLKTYLEKLEQQYITPLNQKTDAAYQKANNAQSTARNAESKSDSAILMAREAKEIAQGVDNVAEQALQLVNTASANILANATKINTNANDIKNLSETKQDNLAFDGNYNAQSNKVATVDTVSREIAKIVAGAPTTFDTLKEIADWISKHPNDVVELNSRVQELQANKQNAYDDSLNTTAKTVVGAINEVNDKANTANTQVALANDKADTANQNAIGALSVAYEANDKAQSALDKADEIGNELVLLDERVTVDIADTLINANNYTDEKVDQAVTDINTNAINPLTEQVGYHGRSIALLQGDIERVEEIAKGANQSFAFENYDTMIFSVRAMGPTELNVGQNIYIKTLGVPDLWVSKRDTDLWNYTYTTDEAFVADLMGNGGVKVGYYTLSALETQKVDLTNYATKGDVETAKTEAIDTASVFVERWF